MGFLKAFGQALKVVGQVVGIVNPFVSMAVAATPTKQDDNIWGGFLRVFGVVMQVEAMAAQLGSSVLTGVQKLQMATPLVCQIFVELLGKMGLKIQKIDAFTASVQQVINGVVGILNACHEDGAKTVERVA